MSGIKMSMETFLYFVKLMIKRDYRGAAEHSWHVAAAEASSGDYRYVRVRLISNMTKSPIVDGKNLRQCQFLSTFPIVSAIAFIDCTQKTDPRAEKRARE